MKINELLTGIRKRDLVLPEFQREYVWSKEKAKQLMVSLVKDYPVGSLLFWKTDKPPELKNIDELPDKLGTIQVILDGQQRLTTLYLLTEGKVPPYYKKRDIQTDPRDLYYSLEDGDFQYYRASLMKGNALWWRVVECFSSDINVFEIARQKAANDQEAFTLANRYNDRLNGLRNVRDKNLAVQTVPSDARLGDAIEIFDRVNSLGTKLTDAELALTHITGTWSQARREMKTKIDELAQRHFRFNLGFMTRALTGVVVRRALFETIHGRSKEELMKGWKRLTKILDYLVTTLPRRAFIHSSADLNTANVLIPLVVYLSLHRSKFPNDRALKHAIHWLYAAHTWARYTGQTDQRLEHDVSLVVREANPWSALVDQIVDQRGRIQVKGDDLEGRGRAHPLYRMTFILAKSRNAVDWCNGAPLGTTHGQAYHIHSHHIFPQSLLYKSGYDADNHLHRKIVNEIANRVFLTAETNESIKDKPPEEYLPKVEEDYPGALVKQFVPMQPELWKVARFGDFLEARRQLIARNFNEFMAALISEPEVMHERAIGELIQLGESATLEFKSTLQWDMVHNRANKELRHSVLKTVAAFLNSDGGTLVIGVEDNGHVLGLANDLKILKGSRDRFEQLLTSLMSEHIGPEYAHLLKIRFETADGEAVCVVDADKAPEPAFLTGPRGKEFYVRVGNTTRALDAEESMRYIQMNWE